MLPAVIIAAGQGSRLSQFYSPKPVAPIYGLKLLERIILAARQVGVQDFKIVVGFKAEVIKQAIGDGTRYGVKIEYIYNPDWRKGNGVSVLRAREHVHGRFLLLMSDHIFDSDILRKLVRHAAKTENTLLAVDRNLRSEYFDLGDVTKVVTEDGKVVRIGKELPEFDAVDTGVFVCSSDIFRALEESTSRGEYSLSAGNQVLAKQGKLEVVDITGSFWVDVDNLEALQKAKQVLIRQLVKQTDGPISRYVNRPLSTRISAYMARFDISPNSITIASFGLSLLSTLAFYLGGYPAVAMGGILAQLSSVLDGCDGEIARLKFRFSVFGEWLDRVLDRYADGLIILGMTHALWLITAREWVWLLGFLTLTGTYLNSYTARIVDEILRNNCTAGRSLRLGRDVRLFIIFLGAVTYQLSATMVLLLVITNLEVIKRLWLLRRITDRHLPVVPVQPALSGEVEEAKLLPKL